MALTKVSTGVVDMSGNTGGLVIAKGNDLERPASPSIGMIRENTETTPGKVEVCTSTGWQFLEEAGPTFVPLTVDYLVVAGGGAGASGYGGIQGGGGGGGGFITSLSGGSGGGSSSESPFTLTVGTQYAVTVGDGGQNVYTLPSATPTPGGDSSAFNSVTALGGGNARSYTSGNNLPSAGSPNYASGGGGTYTGGSGGSYPGSGTSTSRGYGGGNGTTSGSLYGGGGGGAGGLGSTTVGGAGKLNSLTGNTSLSYSGGGGNSWGNPRGGAGQSALSNGNGISGAANTGGGGGGGRGNSGYGGNGGSGIVILRYPSAYTVTKSSPLVSSVDSTAVSGYKIETFTSGTGTITFALNP